MAGAFVGFPGALAIGGGKAGVSAVEHGGDAASWGIIVIALKDIAEGIDRLFVTVAEVVGDDFDLFAVGLHAGGEAPDPDVAIVAFESGDFLFLVGATHAESAERSVGELGAGVALIPVPETIGASGDAVEAMIVLASPEASEQDITGFGIGSKFAVAIGVGVDEQIWGLRNDDPIFENGDTEWGGEARGLDEDRAPVGVTGPGGVFEDDDAIAFGAAIRFSAIVDAFGDIETTLGIEVDIRGVIKHWGGGPKGDLEAIGNGKQFGGNESIWGGWRGGGRGSFWRGIFGGRRGVEGEKQDAEGGECGGEKSPEESGVR